MALGHVVRRFLSQWPVHQFKDQQEEQRLLMSSMSFSHPYMVAQRHFNEGFHKKFDQEICTPTQLAKIRVLSLIRSSSTFDANLVSCDSMCYCAPMIGRLRFNWKWNWFNWTQRAKWSFWSKSVKAKVDQVDFWSTINSMMLFSYFNTNLIIKSREVEVWCETCSWRNLKKFLNLENKD